MTNHNDNENLRLVPAGIIQATYFKTFKYILPVYLVLLKHSRVADDGSYVVSVSDKTIFRELDGLPISMTDVVLLVQLFETGVMDVECRVCAEYKRSGGMHAVCDIDNVTHIFLQFEPKRSLEHEDQDVWLSMDEIDQRIQTVKELVKVDPCLAAESMYKEL